MGRYGKWFVLVGTALFFACGGGEEVAKKPTPKGKADGADAVVITKADDGKTFKVVEGQSVVVELPANPSTGYSWQVVSTDRTFGYPEEEYVADLAYDLGFRKAFENRRARISKGVMPVNSPPPQRCHGLDSRESSGVNSVPCGVRRGAADNSPARRRNCCYGRVRLPRSGCWRRLLHSGTPINSPTSPELHRAITVFTARPRCQRRTDPWMENRNYQAITQS